MNIDANKKQKRAIAGVLAVGALLAGLILSAGKGQPESAEHGHGGQPEAAAHGGQEPNEAGQPRSGPHGGKLFAKDGYAIEVTIFEQGSEPLFRLYPYLNGQPLDPAASEVSLTLERLGQASQTFTFSKEKDYLKADAAVAEPHSFSATLVARHGQQSYRFTYQQSEARLAMSAQQVAENKVEVLTAGPARIKTILQLIGEIRLNEDRQVHVVPRLSGIVETATVNAGDRVRKGQVLAVIASQALADQRSELLAAQRRLALAQTTYAREKKLWEEKISAEQDYLQARNAMQEAEIVAQNARQKLASVGGELHGRGNLTRYEIRAPLDGIVVEKHISLGEAVKDDANIFVIADLATVWAEMTVSAKDLNTVKVGQRVAVKASAFESQSSGVIAYVGSLVGEQTRSAKARLVLANPQGIWRPGLPVNIELVADEREVAVAVSAEAIQSLADNTVVFGRYADLFEARPVRLGRSDGKFIEVVDGLRAGEQYAAQNSFLIKAELGKSGAGHEH